MFSKFLCKQTAENHGEPGNFFTNFLMAHVDPWNLWIQSENVYWSGFWQAVLAPE
jgi:hypothetical protein